MTCNRSRWVGVGIIYGTELWNCLSFRILQEYDNLRFRAALGFPLPSDLTMLHPSRWFTYSLTLACYTNSTDAEFSAQKASENVWRPGSARTRLGSLSAPPDLLAAKKEGVGAGEGKGLGKGERGRDTGRERIRG